MSVETAEEYWARKNPNKNKSSKKSIDKEMMLIYSNLSKDVMFSCLSKEKSDE